ncbi:MAG: 1-acyl-sn-glycerol-3-phosphate acyltransferase, partial [Sulfuricurvum sp.]|nr:1-acyl-sn-glycerol-3-phosphate acyltransferase [Sulfuricurvum sp.]
MVSVETILKKEHPRLFTYPDLISKAVVGLTRFLVHENSINHFMQVHENKRGLDFIDAVLEHLGVSYKVIHREVENIPAIGKVIIVANHPLGALDALSLIQMICSVRHNKKVKIVANKMISSIPQLKEFIIGVDNFSDKLSRDSLRKIDTALQAEEVVIFFPSGEVSRVGLFGQKEGSWKGGFVRFAKRNATPIVPIFIKAKNSSLFYAASWIYKPLGTLLLGHEIFAARNQIFDFRVGELINPKVLNDVSMSERYHAKMFRKHLIRLSKGKKGFYPTESSIAHPVSRQEIRQELKRGERLGETSDNKQIYLIEYDNARNLINEIGRLREYSFRKVGEGSGNSRDIDEYDRY